GKAAHRVIGREFTDSVYKTGPTPSAVIYAAVQLLIDPLHAFYTPATERPPLYGTFATGLSSDDAGGLRYLLNESQVRMEELLPDVHLAPGNPGTLVGTAYRPGMEKITFVAHPTGSLSGEFLPFTNKWTDLFY